MSAQAEEILKGSPTILVVDDEELMREVTALMIEDHGGRTLTASDGEDAVSIFRQNSEDIDIIFLDFSMPKMNGYEAYLKIREISDRVSFVMVSGLSVTDQVKQLADQREVLLLSKPFREEELIAALNQATR